MSTFQNSEFRLLVEIARQQDYEVDGKYIARLINQELDWDYLIELAGYHGMLPLLHLALKNVDANTVPTEIFDYLKEYNFKNTQGNIYVLGELLKLIRALQEKSILAIPFKGPIFSKQLYDNYVVRQSGDLDIMVKQENVLEVVEILRKMGYHLIHHLSRNQQIAIVNVSSEKDLSLVRQNSKLLIEVHWQFSRGDVVQKNDTRLLWNCTKEEDINNNRLTVFKPEVIFLFLCFHGFKHNWYRLFWIWELAEFIDKHADLDWDWIIEHAENFGGRRVLLVGLLINHRLLGTEIPAAINKLFSQDKGALKVVDRFQIEPAPNKIEVADSFKMSMRNRFLIKSNPVTRARMLIHFSFTPAYYDILPIDLPPTLHFLYYFIRPFRLMFTYIPKLFSK